MSEPRWLTREVVLHLHGESIGRFGGSPGLRDEALLESALARPRHRWAYDDQTPLTDLAAAYGFGLARNHAFIDGNKRIAVIAIAAFLGANGRQFDPDEEDEVTTILALAAGELDEAALATWIRENTAPP